MAAEPLANLRVLVTRPRGQADALCRLIESAGGRAVEVPTVEIESTGRDADLLGSAAQHDAIVFTSPNAVEHAGRLVPGVFGLLEGCHVFAVGPGTRDALAAHGVAAASPPADDASSEGLLRLAAFVPFAAQGKRILIVRGEGGREFFGETLRGRGAAVVFAEVYRRVLPADGAARLDDIWRAGGPDIMVVTSRQGLDNLVAMTAAARHEALFARPLVAISGRVGDHARARGFSRVRVAASASDAGLMEAILQSREIDS
jgi:uroporphyrinogen-III synthase